MKLSKAVQEILHGENVQNKIVDLSDVSVDRFYLDLPNIPARNSKIKFSNIQKKFPKKFESNEAKAFALHSFANHELLAIEIMAVAIAKFNQLDISPKFITGIISALKDEQKHFKLYVERINQLGFEFGDFPLNDFFWKYVEEIKTPEHYLSLISLTFESANLDFSYYYAQKFSSVEDTQSHEIMMEVYKDEISHVKFGEHFMGQWRGDSSLWEYYLKNLIHPLTPARSKGIQFNLDRRLNTGLDKTFQNELNNYEDDFRITKRKCNTTSNH